MSGTAAVSTLFTAATTATGAELDGNFSTILYYINDPTNRNNYATDTGTTNSFAIACSPAVAGYTLGTWVTFRASTTNSGASTLNVNSLGPKNIFTAAGSAFSGGEVTVGQMVNAAYDGTQFQIISVPASQFAQAASAAQMTAAAAINVFVTPGRQQYHPASFQAWAYWNGTNTGTITAASGYNVSSIARTGAGTYVISLTNPLSSTVFGLQVTALGATSFVGINGPSGIGRHTQTITISMVNTSGNALDASEITVGVLGKLA